MGSINATLLGQFILISACIMTVLGYYLGKRKTQTPFVTTLLCVFSALIPPIALIFLFVLVIKDDVQSKNAN